MHRSGSISTDIVATYIRLHGTVAISRGENQLACAGTVDYRISIEHLCEAENTPRAASPG